MKHTILESSKHKLPCEVPTTIVLCQLTKAGPDEDMMEAVVPAVAKSLIEQIGRAQYV